MKYTVPHLPSEAEKQKFVEEADSAFEARMEAALAGLGTERRFFGLTGPTCSGKTTAAARMTRAFADDGITVQVISLDDFYYDKEYLHRRADADPDIEIDYDSEETIDNELFAEQTNRLFAGKDAFIPHFDFESGSRIGGRTLKNTGKDVFLFEGIQILYPKIREIFAHVPGYCSIAICPTSSIEVGGELFEPNEIRFYRRLVRDFRHRATDAAFTAYLWESVRANEEKNIFPFMPLCNFSIDSTLPYEIGMLKPHLVPLLRGIKSDDPFYAQAQAILQKFDAVQEISSDYMTEQSLYKEFI